MINIEINWIKENIRIEDDKKNTYGVVRFSEVDLVQIERSESLEADYKNAVMNMLDNDSINMRDNETGEEVYDT